ncbi:ABC transporter ATP-binding protein [Risungbinella massiliensis]|uniref:ABC transporter ATP-binding protein n=1 Tax=Risungbinella massiliensis TaxID=1329796 RepID=UPI0005CBFED7|nr:ABC transporter ATP-binding protein [Risungbinella massiliensis]
MIVSLQQVRKSFSGRNVIQDISFTVNQGEIFALLGRNGAGKSTMLHLLTGLQRADQGTIRIGKRSVQEFPIYRKKVGVMIQNQDYDDHLTIQEHISYLAKLKEVPNVQQETIELLNLVDLQNIANRRVGSLSHGNKKRLGLAIALIGNPKLLLLDEPTAHLDSHSIQHTHQLLREQAKKGTAILLTTAIAEEAEAIGERVGILENGRLERIGAPIQLRERSSKRNQFLRIQTEEVLPEQAKRMIRKIQDQTNGKAVYNFPYWHIELDIADSSQLMKSVYPIFHEEQVVMLEVERSQRSLYDL